MFLFFSLSTVKSLSCWAGWDEGDYIFLVAADANSPRFCLVSVLLSHMLVGQTDGKYRWPLNQPIPLLSLMESAIFLDGDILWIGY